jgi:PAS domain-containing protein
MYLLNYFFEDFLLISIQIILFFSQATFKLKKRELQKEGILESVKDPIYIIDSDNRTYAPLTQECMR